MSKQIVDQDQLIKLAGKECYKRGLAAFDTLVLKNFHSTDNRLEADIDGYHVKLRYRGEIVEGNCNCPESDGFDFCQHCVQLVLYSNKRAKQLMSLSKGPDKSKIFAFLLEQDKQVLVKQLLEFLENDSQQFDRYLLKASLAAETLDASELRQRITELTKVTDKQGLFSQRQVKAFFKRLDVFFGELNSADLSRHANALKLIEYAILRVNQVLDQVDEKWGYRNPVVNNLRHSFSTLYSLLVGRDLTRVKRFEKLFFVDRHHILGVTPEPFLGSDVALLGLFEKRMQWLWSTHVSCKLSVERRDAKLYANLPVIEHDWQSKKLAVYLSKCDTPQVEDRFVWMRSVREQLLHGPESWLAWLDEVENEFGANPAAKCALDALRKHPSHHRLIHKCADLIRTDEMKVEDLSPLIKANPIAVLEWMLGLEPLQQISLPSELSQHLFESIKRLSPRDEFDEPVVRGCDVLMQWLAVQPQINVERTMAQDAKVPMDVRIELARRFDQTDPAISISIREALIPQLLGKNQNKADRLAAEQTVLLKQNIAALGMGEDKLEAILVGFEDLIRKRGNYIHLVQQYSQKEVSFNE